MNLKEGLFMIERIANFSKTYCFFLCRFGGTTKNLCVKIVIENENQSILG